MSLSLFGRTTRSDRPAGRRGGRGGDGVGWGGGGGFGGAVSAPLFEGRR